MKKEGLYTLKKVDKLPKKGNNNWLYFLSTDNPITTLYEPNINGSYEEINIGGSGGDIYLQSGTNVTITGTGTQGDPYIINSSVSDSDLVLEAINEGNGIGYVVKGRNIANYGNVGNGAFDFSFSNSASSTKGATGTRSIAFGLNNTVSTPNSMVVGESNVLSGSGVESSIMVGYENYGSSWASAILGANNNDLGGNNGMNIVGGYGNTAYGWYNGYFGAGLNSDGRRTRGTVYLGLANDDIGGDYTAGSNPQQPMIVVGNGELNSSYPYSIVSKSNLLLARKNGQFSVPSTTIATIDGHSDGKVLVTREWVLAKGGADSPFISIDEGNGVGYYPSTTNLSYFGNIGEGALNLAYNTSGSSDYGATGDYSLAVGYAPTASGNKSFAQGDTVVASGNSSSAFGSNSEATSINAFASGAGSEASGANSAAFNNSVSTANRSFSCNNSTSNGDYSFSANRAIAYSFSEVSIGTFETSYTPNSTSSWNTEDRLFNIGNGTSLGSRNDAFTIYKNGAAVFHPVAKSSITNATAGMLISNSESSNRLEFYDGSAWQVVSLTPA